MLKRGDAEIGSLDRGVAVVIGLRPQVVYKIDSL
jgi:hypothetical protein